MQIKCLDRFGPLITKPKRIKILVGGRASTKSTFVADHVLARMTQGGIWCCGREFQNSVDESVHRLLLDEVDRIGLPGFRTGLKTELAHASGGRSFYRGLARNVESLKGQLSGLDGVWVEEGETLSDSTLRVMSASMRVTAKDAQAYLDGDTEELKMPELWITMNRRSQADPISKKYLARAEEALLRKGYYEDNVMIIVQANYTDMPRKWFLASGLEAERADDEKMMSRDEYEHKWLGQYLETVQDAIIRKEWFDACVDAHKKLGWEARGAVVAAHDPSDEGGDSKGLAIRHGNVFTQITEFDTGNVNEGLDWALDESISAGADLFIWDCDGMGSALRREVETGLKGKKCDFYMFKGSESPSHPDTVFEPGDESGKNKAKTNKQTFGNKRAQHYMALRKAMMLTYRAVKLGEYVDPAEMISISSDIENLGAIRAEVCRIPRNRRRPGLIYIMSKQEMIDKLKVSSPNMADAMMMAMVEPESTDNSPDIEFDTLW